MTLAEARALVPTLQAQSHEPQRDAELLERLALWAQRFSPLTEARSPDTILVDVTGCERLFRGVGEAHPDRVQGSGFRIPEQGTKASSAAKATEEGTEGRRDEGAKGPWSFGSQSCNPPVPPSLRPSVPPSLNPLIPQSLNPSVPHGEINLLRLAVDGLAAQGFFARGAIADTIGAAWALARAGPARTIVVPKEETVAALMPLPPWSLRLADNVLGSLDLLGVNRIETLLHLPRASVAARFGDAVLRRIDQATGDQLELLEPLRPVALPAAGMGFPAPTDRQDALFVVADRLLTSFCEQLAHRCAGVRALHCILYREQQPPETLTVTFSQATQSFDHITALLKTRLERVDLSEGITGLQLWSPATHRLTDVQELLFDDEATPSRQHDVAWAGLVDRLTNRLGRRAVVRPQLLDDHQPEHAYRNIPADESGPGAQATGPMTLTGGLLTPGATGGLSASVFPCPQSNKARAGKLPVAPHFSTGPRPLRLLSRPCPVRVMAVVPDGPPTWFYWSGKEYAIAHAFGPERIETGWWKREDIQRDYFLVTAESGSRFWLFRDRRSGRWFVHGCYD